ncbi:MAG: hypothetical protein HYR63_20355 [Proteobacteria bacterium]|nr:hypothetical protein [Pseudomonadota bacterium]MBI3497044.1 hypothetical protein [Pseudomonadota bacterium]
MAGDERANAAIAENPSGAERTPAPSVRVRPEGTHLWDQLRARWGAAERLSEAPPPRDEE